jgi:hypothetical protein
MRAAAFMPLIIALPHFTVLLYSDANIFLEDEKKFTFHGCRINRRAVRINSA